MPGIIKVKILGAKDLPVMDRASDLTDAFVEVRHGATVHKTDVCRKSLNPTWNSEWLRFEADDEQLQDEPLQVKVLDYDVYSAHDTIGKVIIGLSSLLLKNGTNELGGWFPIYDTLHGIRGYIQISVRIDFFVDTNKYRHTSCGVRFFSTSAVPSGYTVIGFQGFVDVMLVNDDPEYQWIDKIRTPRASNDARIRLFSKLSGEVSRRLGLKVIDVGGNAVLGYSQCFDIEGDTGIVVRGSGSSVTLVKSDEARSGIGSLSNSPDASSQYLTIPSITNDPFSFQSKPSIERVRRLTFDKQKQKTASNRYNRTISSSSEGNDIVNEASLLLNTSDESPDIGFNYENFMMNTPNIKAKSVDELEFPFLTIVKLPPGFVVHIGGIVSSKSVKLLDEINSFDGHEIRELWWNELRTEIRSHAKALGCHAVLGYTENATICDDMMILSAMGTAAIIRLPDFNLGDQFQDDVDAHESEGKKVRHVSECESEDSEERNEHSISAKVKNSKCYNCRAFHVPFSDAELPFNMNLSKCSFCKHGKVPDFIFATIEPLPEAMITGTGCIIQARVSRTKKRDKGEVQAESVSQLLPFLEYELHRQLMTKLKVKGMNAVFGIKMQVCVSENLVLGMMTGTAVYVSALPAPPLFVVSGNKDDSSYDEKKMLELQKRIIDETAKNRARMNLYEAIDVFSTKTPPNTPVFNVGGIDRSNIDHTVKLQKFEDIQGQLDLVNGVKESFVVTVDDNIEDEILLTLADTFHIDGGNAFSTEATPGIFSENLMEYQFMTVFHRKKLTDDDFKTSMPFPKICEDLILALHFKLRKKKPYVLSKVTFNLKIPEDNEMQVSLTAFASKLGVMSGRDSSVKNLKGGKENDDFSFPFEISDFDRHEEDSILSSINTIDQVRHSDIYSHHVVISPSFELPAKTIEQYLGNLNLFFIRETMDVKEDGGLNMFMQTFIAEVYAIVRSHVAALSGDGILSFTINDVTLLDSSHKNQGQCLLNVSGDVVKFTSEHDVLPQLSSKHKNVTSVS